jgi:serine/threonine-protein kinase
VPSGHIVYLHQGSLFAVPYNSSSRTTSGGPVPVVDGVSASGGGLNYGGRVTSAAQFAVANAGVLVYVRADPAASARTLVWVDRQGHETPVPAPPRLYAYGRLSPDGYRIALDVRDDDQDIWTWDIARQTLTRITFDPGADTAPVWTPDGQRLLWSRVGLGLLSQAADGSGMAEQLTQSGANVHAPASMTRDGGTVLFSDLGPKGYATEVLTLADKKVAPLLDHSSGQALDPEISPDGHWLAYEAAESGGRPQVWVRPYPDVNSGRRQISRDGGTRPLWSHDGRELFFMAGTAINTGGAPLMAVDIETTPTFQAGNPRELFPGPYFSGLAGRTYDVTADGQKFLMIKPAAGASASHVIIVQNWFDDLKRRVPPR